MNFVRQYYDTLFYCVYRRKDTRSETINEDIHAISSSL